MVCLLFLKLPVSDVRPNLPCGAGFMFATDFPQYVAPCNVQRLSTYIRAGTAASLSLFFTAAKYKPVAAATCTSYPSSSSSARASTRSSATSAPSSSRSPSRRSLKAHAGAHDCQKPRARALSHIDHARQGRRYSVNKYRSINE